MADYTKPRDDQVVIIGAIEVIWNLVQHPSLFPKAFFRALFLENIGQSVKLIKGLEP